MSRSGALPLGLLLLAAIALRAYRLDQPIVENYVGRQIPTAMVARNLDRGLGFLHPQLDTGPFPNYFLVEPPLYQALVVALMRTTGLPLVPSGRLVSACGIAIAAWGLFGLARRRKGEGSALLAAAAFVSLPITIRYGRAFQPDALMLGALLAGANLVDQSRPGGRFVGLILLSLGLAMKVTSAFVLVPLVMSSQPNQRMRRALWLSLALLPAVAWYGYATWLVASTTTGSQATAGAGRAWLEALGPLALLDRENLARLARFLLVRSFTPLLPPLLALAWLLDRGRSNPDRFWSLWTLACAAMLLLIAGKLHHEYYLLALSPPVALGMSRGLETLRDRLGPRSAVLAVVALGAASGFGVRSTWHTPADWRALDRASAVVRDLVPPHAWLIAPEALLFAADRRGCRLEVGPSAERAASEWGGSIDPERTLALVRFYQSKGARYFADLTDPPPDPARKALHVAVRKAFPLRYDSDGVLVAELPVSGVRFDEPQGVAGDRAGLRPLEGRGSQDRRPDGL